MVGAPQVACRCLAALAFAFAGACAAQPYTADGNCRDGLPHGNYELRDTKDLKLPSKEHKPVERELAMAERLIEDMAGGWEPDQYKDQYRDRLLDLIRRKAKSGTKGLPEPEEPEVAAPSRTVDLADLLRRSLERRQDDGRASSSTRATRAGRARASRRRSHA